METISVHRVQTRCGNTSPVSSLSEGNFAPIQNWRPQMIANKFSSTLHIGARQVMQIS